MRRERGNKDLSRQVLLSPKPDEFDDDIEHAWATEIHRRREAVRCGDVKLLDWVDARQQILDELNQARSV